MKIMSPEFERKIQVAEERQGLRMLTGRQIAFMILRLLQNQRCTRESDRLERLAQN